MKKEFDLQKVFDVIVDHDFYDIEDFWNDIVENCIDDLEYSEELINQHKDEILNMQEALDEEQVYRNIEQELGYKLYDLDVTKEQVIAFVNRFYNEKF